jgi:beta-glucosidase
MKKVVLCFFCTFSFFCALAWSQEEAKDIYKDPNAPIPDRVRDLLKRMTVEEKVAQLESGWMLPSIGSLKAPSIFDRDQLDEAVAKRIAGNGLGTYIFLDEFLGMSGPFNPCLGARHRNLLQAWVLKNTRLGIPILSHGDALHGAITVGATSFPEAVGLGSTWDPELLERMFATVAPRSASFGKCTRAVTT